MKNFLKYKIFIIKITFKNGLSIIVKAHGYFKINIIRKFLTRQYFKVKSNNTQTIYKTEDVFAIEFI